MKRVVICEGERFVCNQVERYIKIYGEKHNEEFQIVKFHNGLDTMEYLKKNYHVQILFLDVLLQQENGINIAKTIRITDRKIYIVFLASCIEYALDGYSVSASNYLLKPINYYSIEQELNKIICNLKIQNQDFLIIKNDTGIFKVYMENISFIETSGRNTMVHLTNGNIILTYRKMKEYEQKLDSSFYRCHNSYIVNMAFIDKIIQHDIYLLDGEIISVSKPRRKKFIISFNEFYGRNFK